MDYATLRADGVRRLRSMAAGTWTDHNAHDPGITILEQVAYVLSDLLYRLEFPVADLLASAGRDVGTSLLPPAEILPCDPVTIDDLRWLVLDVPGVRNAWVERSANVPEQLHYHPGRRELALTPDPPASVAVTPQGVYVVLVDVFDLASASSVRAQVAERVFAHRPLCTDIADVVVLPPQLIQVDATIEIEAVDDVDTLLVDVLERISDQLAPPVRLADRGDAARAGVPVAELFDGPHLQGGYAPAGSLPDTGRRSTLRTSDLVHAIMDVPAVRAITRLTVAAGGDAEPWVVELDPESTPRLDLAASTITLTRGGLRTGPGIGDVREAFQARRASLAEAQHPESDVGVSPPAGRDRHVGRYHSLQHHLPALYGVADMGLPASAPPERRAQAKQLTAYLLILDQVIANMYAQLAHVGDLFAFEAPSMWTYFAGVVDDDRLGLDAVRDADVVAHTERVAELLHEAVADDAPQPGGRRDRFLTHLLARFAEQLPDATIVEESGPESDGGVSSGERIVRNKERYLRRYSRVSGSRGTAPNDLRAASSDNESGLEERVRLQLGLDREAGEDLVLVEHVLLRPIAGDAQQAIAFLTDSDQRDPYSLRLTCAFPDGSGRFVDDGFRRLVEHTVRSETPAHLVAHVLWLESGEWETLRDAHLAWREQRRSMLRTRFGVGSA